MNDTIAAISTSPGEGGIGIVRISGDLSGIILKRVFKKSGMDLNSGCRSMNSGLEYSASTLVTPTESTENHTLRDIDKENRRMYHGYILDSAGDIIDEVLSVFMKGPKSYTGEDVAEIHCHGSVIALGKVLDRVISEGAAIAEPGEFTKRAFLNGRIDLSQAEAVIDVIKAKTETAHNSAIQHLDGSLSAQIKKMRGDLLEILVSIAVELDYPEENEQYFSNKEILKRLSVIGDILEKLRQSFYTGRIIRQGLKIAIIGKPNVGKSSLFNALLRESRAIVTEIPGTTRDTIEDDLNINGILIRLIDTAGIRNTTDEIEMLGVNRSKDALNTADIVLLVVDGSEALRNEDIQIIGSISDRPVVVLINKEDLGIQVSAADIEKLLPNANTICTSMKFGLGIEELLKAIEDYVYQGKARAGENLLITNSRHKLLLDKAAEEINDGILLSTNDGTVELIEICVSQAYDFLGKIIGETVGDDVINEVFSRFCLGK